MHFLEHNALDRVTGLRSRSGRVAGELRDGEQEGCLKQVAQLVRASLVKDPRD